jgi:hypothetical protein
VVSQILGRDPNDGRRIKHTATCGSACLLCVSGIIFRRCKEIVIGFFEFALVVINHSGCCCFSSSLYSSFAFGPGIQFHGTIVVPKISFPAPLVISITLQVWLAVLIIQAITFKFTTLRNFLQLNDPVAIVLFLYAPCFLSFIQLSFSDRLPLL